MERLECKNPSTKRALEAHFPNPSPSPSPPDVFRRATTGATNPLCCCDPNGIHAVARTNTSPAWRFDKQGFHCRQRHVWHISRYTQQSEIPTAPHATFHVWSAIDIGPDADFTSGNWRVAFGPIQQSTTRTPGLVGAVIMCTPPCGRRFMETLGKSMSERRFIICQSSSPSTYHLVI